MKRKIFHAYLKKLLLLFFLFTTCNISPIYAKNIIIGQSLPFSEEKTEQANAFYKGCMSWIKYFNDQGGINGTKIEVMMLNDYGAPRLVKANTQKFIQENVFLLFGYMGYESSIIASDLAEKSNIPFFGSVTGASELHKFPKNTSFFIRPGYDTEITNVLNDLIDNNYKKISFFYSSDKTGESALKAAQWCFNDKQLPVFTQASVKVHDPDIEKAVNDIISGTPDAVIIAANSNISSLFIKQLRDKQPQIKIITLSDTNGKELSEKLFNHGIGVVISQVVPFPFYQKIPVVRQFNQISNQYYPDQQITFAGFEGFITAKAMTSVLEQCQDNLTRENFMEKASLSNPINLGGFSFNFTKEDRTGSKTTYFTQIGPGGFLSPIRSLKDIYKYSPL